jgi:acetyl esterase
MAVDPEIQVLLDFLAEGDRPAMSAGTADEARAAFRILAVDLRDPASAPDVASISEITVDGGAGPRPARVYRPHTIGPLPTIVFVHGGGWVIGDLDTHDPLARLLAVRCDAVVVSVDYRLAPEHPFPAAVEDAVAATRWASEHLDELGGNAALAVSGDSAGGNLSAVVAQLLRDDVPLAGQLLLYPGTDILSELPSRTENAEGYFLDLDMMEWFGAQYVGHLAHDLDQLTDPRLSPLRGELAGLPPAVVVVAEFDPLRDEGAAYAEAMEGAGVPVTLLRFDGMIHGFLDMLQYSEAARVAGDETCRRFRELLHS